MRTLKAEKTGVEQFLEIIEGLPFVRSVRWIRGHANRAHYDGFLTVLDPERRRYEFSTEVKKSYLDHAAANATIAKARLGAKGGERPPILLARYVPAPTGGRFADAGVNFVDLAGNMNVVLGNRYSRTVLGQSEAKPGRERLGMTAGQLQVLILFATYPEAAEWPVRDIAVKAGVGKSAAAAAKQRIVEAGLFERHPDGYHLLRLPRNEDLILTGYSQVLRPKLFVGRFQSSFHNPDEFIRHLSSISKSGPHRFAITGGPAAHLLHPYYRGPHTPIFATDAGRETRRLLRLLPDREGPITLLKAFGELVFWREMKSVTISPPWLIYAELMQSPDPRAHEAAEEFRRGFLES
jgi:hypothetical protein